MAHYRPRRSAVLTAVAVLVAIPTGAAAVRAEVTTDPDSTAATTDSLHTTVFTNGVQLLVLPQPERALVQVDVYLSLRTAGHRRDLPHLVEHLMFRSSENCPSGSLRDSLQLLTTFYNGYTSSRQIRTIARCLPRHLPRLLAVNAEQFGRLRPTETDLAVERRRVLGEVDFREELSTWSALDRRVAALAYDGDPLAADPERRRADIWAIGLADVDSFLVEAFAPERTVVLVRGPVPADSVATHVAATFGALVPTGRESVAPVRPPRQPTGHTTIRTEDRSDVLAVGFRLPYGTRDEIALVHLVDTIMDREDGNTYLHVFGDEALMVLHIRGRWSRNREAEEGARLALEQFWSETRTVQHRVGDAWLFERNRRAHVEYLRERRDDISRRATWRAQLLAAGRDLPPLDVIATMIDSLDQEQVHAFFLSQFTPDNAHTAFAAGKTPRDRNLANWHRGLRLSINPYLLDRSSDAGIGAAQIAPVLAAARATGIGHGERQTLDNGVPLVVIDLPSADAVAIGGVRTYPPVDDEAAAGHPGRLVLFEPLVNAGYGRKGANIAPKGKDLDWDTTVDVNLTWLTVSAGGPADKLGDITAALRKRIAVAKLNGYAYLGIARSSERVFREWSTWPPLIGWNRLMADVCGEDSPFAGWLRPDPDAAAAWSADGADELHRKLFRTGNFQFVVVGRDASAAVGTACVPPLSELREAEPVELPPLPVGTPRVSTAEIEDAGSEVAHIDVGFPPWHLAESPAPSATDLMIIAQAVEARLVAAAYAAGLDAVRVKVDILPAGGNALAVARVTCPPDGIPIVQGIVRDQLDRLAEQPLTPDETARARLQLLGPLLEALIDPRDTIDLLLNWGCYGSIPADPVGALCGSDDRVLRTWTTRLFPADHFAIVVLADKTRVAGAEGDVASP